MRTLRLVAAALALGWILPLGAADAPPAKPVYHPAGEASGKVGKVDVKLTDGGGTLTLQVAALEPGRSRSGRSKTMHAAAKDVEVALAADVKVRWHDAPVKDENGKPRKPTNDEYAKLKGPGDLPGFQAELSDLKAGQAVTVKLAKYKDGGQEKMVVTQVMILADAPPGGDKAKK